MHYRSVMSLQNDRGAVPPSAPLRASVRGVLCLTACTGTPSSGKAALLSGLIDVPADHPTLLPVPNISKGMQCQMPNSCAITLIRASIAGAREHGLAVMGSTEQTQNRQLASPASRAVSGCPDQPPSTLILLAGPAPPSISSASAATDTASVN